MAPVCKRPHILLVEDSFDDAFFFRRALRQIDIPCELLHLPDGSAALVALQRMAALPVDHPERPDLVFLDLKLPVYDGFELLAWIFDLHVVPAGQVAILSGSEDGADVRRARSLGVEAYYSKPLRPEQLRARLLACGFHPYPSLTPQN